jgi:hypothetical protein
MMSSNGLGTPAYTTHPGIPKLQHTHNGKQEITMHHSMQLRNRLIIASSGIALLTAASFGVGYWSLDRAMALAQQLGVAKFWNRAVRGWRGKCIRYWPV